MIVLLALGTWFAVLLFVLSLCRAAALSDDATDTADLGAELRYSTPGNAPLRTLDLDEAAALLAVPPELLLAWEARYGFPISSPIDRLYSRSEVLALRNSLRSEASIASAVAHARERTQRRRPTARAPVGGEPGFHDESSMVCASPTDAEGFELVERPPAARGDSLPPA
ncbi:MAG TPA: hypothetical protein VMJ65_00385 [Solirubrobacteraceae bacterium]|nr:hypothetical protein [Solirubrobacteraceae bacterium]